MIGLSLCGVVGRVAKNIENTTLALAKDLHCFRGSASFDPQKCLSALASNQLQGLQWFWPRGKPRKLRNFEVETFSRILEKHIFFTYFFDHFRAICVIFSRLFEDSLKNLEIFNLTLALKFEDFWGWSKISLEYCKLTSASKNPQTLLETLPSTSKYPRISRPMSRSSNFEPQFGNPSHNHYSIVTEMLYSRKFIVNKLWAL